MTHDEDPIDRLKEQLRLEILALVGGWDQYVAARRLGTDQPRMSNLHHGRLERFSLEKLIRLLARIDRRVDLTIVNVGRGSLRMFLFPPHRSPRGSGRRRSIDAR